MVTLQEDLLVEVFIAVNQDTETISCQIHVDPDIFPVVFGFRYEFAQRLPHFSRQFETQQVIENISRCLFDEPSL